MNRLNLWEKVELPPELLGRLNAMIHRIRALQLTRGVLAVVAMALVTTLAIMAIDAAVVIVSDTVRIGFTLGGLVLVLLTVWVALVRPLSDRITPVRMARILETRHPELQERISSALELLGQGDDAASEGSSQLLEILASDAMADISSFSAKGEFRGLTLRPVMIVAAVAFALLLLLFAIWPRQTGILFVRAVAPTAPVGNLAARTLAVEPGDVTLVRGQSVRFRLTIPGESLTRAELWIERPGEARSVERLGRRPILPGDEKTVYDLLLPAVKDSFRYRISVGSALTRHYDVTVVDPPAHGGLRYLLSYPAYTGLATTQFVASAPVPLRLPAGTEASVEADLNRALFASLLLGERRLAPEEAPPSTTASWSWLVSTNRYARRWGLSLHDERGFTNRVGWATYEAIPDYPAHLRLTYPSGGSFVLPTYGLLKLVYEVRDDYGYEQMQLAILPDNERVPWYAEVTPEPIGDKVWRITQEVHLDDFQLGGARKLRIWLEVSDNLPVALGGPNVSRSRIVAVQLDNGSNKSFADQVRVPERDSITKSLASTVERLEKAAKALEAATNKLAKASSPADSDAVAAHLAEAEKEAAEAQVAADEALEKAQSGLFAGMTDDLKSLSEESTKPAFEAVAEVAMADEGEIPAFAAEAIESLRAVKDEAEKLVPEVEKVDKILEESSAMEAIAARQEHQAKLATERQMTSAEMDKWIERQQELTKSIDELGTRMNLENEVEEQQKVGTAAGDSEAELERKRAEMDRMAAAARSSSPSAASDGKPSAVGSNDFARAQARQSAEEASEAAAEAVKAVRGKPRDEAVLERARAAEQVARRARDAAAMAERGARSLDEAKKSEAGFEHLRKEAAKLEADAKEVGEAALEVKMEAIRYEAEPLPPDVARAVDLAGKAGRLAEAAEKAAALASAAHPEEAREEGKAREAQAAPATQEKKSPRPEETGTGDRATAQERSPSSARSSSDEPPPLEPKALAAAAEALAKEAEALRGSIDPAKDPFLAKSAEIASEAARRAADVAAAVKASEKKGADEDAARDAAAEATAQAVSAKKAADAAARSAGRAALAPQDQAALAAREVAELAEAVSNMMTRAAADFEQGEADKKLPDFLKRLEGKARSEEKSSASDETHRARESVAASKRALEAAGKAVEMERAGRPDKALEQDVEARRQANEAVRLAEGEKTKGTAPEADPHSLATEASRLAERVSGEVARGPSPFEKPAAEAEKGALSLEKKASELLAKGGDAKKTPGDGAEKTDAGVLEAGKASGKAREALASAREALDREAKGDHQGAREEARRAEAESAEACRLAEKAADALGTEPLATDVRKLAHTVSNLVAAGSAAIETPSEKAARRAEKLARDAREKASKSPAGNPREAAEAKRDEAVAGEAARAVEAMEAARKAESAGRHEEALRKTAEAEDHAVQAVKEAVGRGPGALARSPEAESLATAVSNLVAQTARSVERPADQVEKELDRLSKRANATGHVSKGDDQAQTRGLAGGAKKTAEVAREALRSAKKAIAADEAGREKEAAAHLKAAQRKANEAAGLAASNLADHPDAGKNGEPRAKEAAAQAIEAKRLAGAVSNLVAGVENDWMEKTSPHEEETRGKSVESAGEALERSKELAEEATDTTRLAQREGSPMASNVAQRTKAAAEAARRAAEAARQADEREAAGDVNQARAKRQEAKRQGEEAARLAREAMALAKPISASAPELAADAAAKAVEAARKAQQSVQAAKELREKAALKPGDPSVLKDELAAAGRAADEAKSAAKEAREAAVATSRGARDRKEEQSVEAASKAQAAADQAENASNAVRQLVDNLSRPQPGAQPTIGEPFLKNAERHAEDAERHAADANRLAERASRSPTAQAADLARQSRNASEALQDAAGEVHGAAARVAEAANERKEAAKAPDSARAVKAADEKRAAAQEELRAAEKTARSIEQGLNTLAQEAASIEKNAVRRKDDEALKSIRSLKGLLDENRRAARQLAEVAGQATYAPDQALPRMGNVADIATNTARKAAALEERIAPAADGRKLDRSIEKAKAAAGSLRDEMTSVDPPPRVPDSARAELASLHDQLRDASSRAVEAADSATEAGQAMRRMAGHADEERAEEAPSPFLPDQAPGQLARTPEEVHAVSGEAEEAAREVADLAARIAERAGKSLADWEESAEGHLARADKASKEVVSRLAQLPRDDQAIGELSKQLAGSAELTDRAIARARGKTRGDEAPVGTKDEETVSSPEEPGESARDIAKEAYEAADEAFRSARAMQAPDAGQLEAGRQANKSAQNMRRMAAEHARLAGLDPETMRRDTKAAKDGKGKKEKSEKKGQSGRNEGGNENPDDSFKEEEAHVDGLAVEMPEFLKKLGFPLSEWIKYRGSLESGQLDEALDKVAPEYRDLVRRYFQLLATEK